MNIITADAALQQSLVNLPGLAEVRDTRGILLGFFSPASQTTADIYVEAAAHFDPNELTRRKASDAIGQSTENVLNRITKPNG
jgi:hypothetical protein